MHVVGPEMSSRLVIRTKDSPRPMDPDKMLPKRPVEDGESVVAGLSASTFRKVEEIVRQIWRWREVAREGREEGKEKDGKDGKSRSKQRIVSSSVGL